ncbi:MAG: hypothetical protein PHG39_11260 [Acidithiobacillus ferrooxidans]|nr:hypothetical protein [Acidithiobacillus ferrooxidans]MDD5003781.1 hypothetical protein [Acidithiobacillus sp.]MDD5378003.1 hypothetical protein [Acidithiobacillus sp.]
MRLPLLNHLHLFRDRSFATATLITGVFGLGLFGTTAMQPLMLEGLLHYMPETTGWVMFPRGVASAVTMMIVGRLINRYQPRLSVQRCRIGCRPADWQHRIPASGHCSGRPYSARPK